MIATGLSAKVSAVKKRRLLVDVLAVALGTRRDAPRVDSLPNIDRPGAVWRLGVWGA